MAGARAWLLSLISLSILCAAAEALMPPGGPRRVGKLVCGLVLLCAVLSPAARLDLEGSLGWMEDWREELERREAVLREQAGAGQRPVIEEKYAAYIVDKAAQLGASVSARVTCREDGDGLLLPDRAEITGALSGSARDRLARALEEELGLPPERQVYREEEKPP